jgi:ParB-like chromosome segregation protein Spo0J
MSDPRQIEYIPLWDLREDPRNPKAHDGEAMAASLRQFSLIDPVVIDGRTGYLISGHGRKAALLDLHTQGAPTPDGITIAPDGTWLVPAVTGWSSRTDAEARAALIALNRIGELGGWVDTALLDLLDELSAQDESLGVGLTSAGFDETTLTGLRAKLDRLTPPAERVRLEIEDGDVEGSAGFAAELDFDEVTFAHRCPSCGFEFNDEGD